MGIVIAEVKVLDGVPEPVYMAYNNTTDEFEETLRFESRDDLELAIDAYFNGRSIIFSDLEDKYGNYISSENFKEYVYKAFVKKEA